jgi:predicted amidohydrolase YtcJ
VWLTRTDVHAGWANTAALEATVGLDRLATMDAPAGGRICRDEAGRPTGVLVDAAMALVEDHIPPPDDARLDRALSTALDHTARHGLTGLHDAGVDLAGIRRFRRRIEDGRFPLRVYAMMDGRAEAFAHFRDAGPLHHPSGRLTVESVKFFADGALGSRGAALLEPYADAPEDRGLLLHDADAFREAVTAVVDAGFQVNTHAIGDRANRFVLNAYAAAARAGTRPLRRPRIEHAQVMHPRDRARLEDLGVVASVQPGFARSDQSWAPDRLGPERLSYAYAWTALQDAGAPLAFGSDAPVDPIDPLRGLSTAVSPPRLAPEAVPLSPPLARAAALRAYTLGAAYAAFQEDEVGSITPGKRADFAVLSQDLMGVPAGRLPDTDVIATYLDGRLLYAQAPWPQA